MAGSQLFIADRVRSFHPGASASPPRNANAVLVRDGRIAAVGPADALRPAADVVVDLPGTTLTPGLTDAHIHITEWALARREVDVTDTDSPADAARLVRARGRPGVGGWIRGRGWNAHRWGVDPVRDVLDTVAPDRPVALQSHDMHSLWVNSLALQRAGIGSDTPDPPGGRIVRDHAGQPTGLLQENATQLVIRRLPAPTFVEMCALVREAQGELHALGITGIHSLPGLYVPEPDPLSVLEALRGSGDLRLRVLQHLPLPFLDDAIHLGLRSGFGGDWIRLGGIKMFLDGALGSRTAWMRAPYETTDDCGIRVLSTDIFRDAVTRAATHGLATTVHAIGDAAVALAVEVLSTSPAVEPLPHRIEHVQCLPLAEDERSSRIVHRAHASATATESVPIAILKTIARANLVCSMQPAHLMTDWPAATRHWGHARARWTYSFRSLLDAGAILAFGSDSPVEPADPRLGLFAATRRTDAANEPPGGWVPEELITLEQAFRGYTEGPAIAASRAGVEGRLAPGALADFVAWNGDPFAAGTDPRRLTCAATVVAGVVVRG